jgi:hypothetical protein
MKGERGKGKGERGKGKGESLHPSFRTPELSFNWSVLIKGGEMLFQKTEISN